MSKYRKCWETKPLLKDWIQPVPDDSTKAYCKACNIKLYAHRYSVLKHTSTKKHQDNYEKMVRLEQNQPIILNLVETQELLDPIGAASEHFSEVTNMSATNGAEQASVQECLLEESIIEGDALDYNESIDVFMTSSSEDSQLIRTLQNGSHESVEDKQSVHADACQEIAAEIIAKHDSEKMPNSPESRTISSHILDTSVGKAAANVEVNIYRLESSEWLLLNQSATNEDGRCAQLVSPDEFTSGIYKLHFNVRPYFAAQNVQSFYPFIEVVVECRQGEHYHVPLLLNPFGYSTYRGT